MRVRTAVAQLNQHVGDYKKNTDKILGAIEYAVGKKADIIIFPELSLNGYPLEDLILKTQYLKDSQKYLDMISEFSKGKNIIIIIGAVEWDVESYNSAKIIYDGKVWASYKKMFLPNYSVFDEKRYFTPGNMPFMIETGGIKIGVTICEDLWVPNGPSLALSQNGANIILNLSASPFHKTKHVARRELVKTRASELSSWIVYANMIGGQDEIVFDGASIIADPYGDVVMQAPVFEEGVFVFDIDPYEATRANLREGKRKHYNLSRYTEIKSINIPHSFDNKEEYKNFYSNIPQEYEQLYLAIKTGIRDYIFKNGFKKAVLGLSGGIDSALVAAIACDAIGSENVLGIMMPSRYSSESSVKDSIILADNLGMKTVNIPIEEPFKAFNELLEPYFEGRKTDSTEENIQARIRGIINMAFSNKFGFIVLSTGNKSEVATGYATLYGDMAGGLSPIKDLYKTEVYKVCYAYNKIHSKDIIPSNIFDKAPSAELRPNQTDQDTLPEYNLLDQILFRYIEREMSLDEIVEDGFNEEIVKFVIKLVDINEYKRRQGAPGIKLTERSFGKERRMPITNGYKIF